MKNKCKWEWQGNGSKVIGLNGNSIFLPASGERCCNGVMVDVGSYGYYWSSSLEASDDVWSFLFNSSTMYMGTYDRCDGRSVRLVKN